MISSNRISAFTLEVLADAKRTESEWDNQIYIDQKILNDMAAFIVSQQLPSGAFRDEGIPEVVRIMVRIKLCCSYYTKILEVNLFAFAYRLFHEDFSLIENAEIFMKQSVGKCKQINF